MSFEPQGRQVFPDRGGAAGLSPGILFSCRVLWTAYAAFIAFMSLWPAPPGPDVPGLDKVLHLGAYGLMALTAPWPVSGRGRTLAWWLGLAVLGLALEGGQGMTSERTPSILDALSNITGAGLGLYARRFLPNLKRS